MRGTGSLWFGYLTDRMGRNQLFDVTLGIYLLGTFATAFTGNCWTFALCRLVADAGIGGEHAAINSATGELIPRAGPRQGRPDHQRQLLGRRGGRRLRADLPAQPEPAAGQSRLAAELRDRTSAVLPAAAAASEIAVGVRAEQESLEDVAPPLAAEDAESTEESARVSTEESARTPGGESAQAPAGPAAEREPRLPTPPDGVR